MSTKHVIGSASVACLVMATVAISGMFATPRPTIPPESAKLAPQNSEAQPCCTGQDCCPECLACCAEDECCWECILCCIEMGCDPACCFPPSLTARAGAPKKAELAYTQPAATTAKGCCADGCCK